MPSLFGKKLSVEQIDTIVNAKMSWILNSCSPLKIIIFGSAATYEMTDASDVDIIVILGFGEDRNLVSQALNRTRLMDDWPHDLFLYSNDAFEASCRKGGGICWVARQEGKIIYSKELP